MLAEAKMGGVFSLFFCGCIFALALGQFALVYKFGDGGIYSFDILLLVFCLAALSFFIIKRKKIQVTVPGMLLCSFCLIGGISLAFSPIKLSSSELLVAGAYLVRLATYVLFYICLHNLVTAGLLKTGTIEKAVVVSGVFLFIAGIIQLIVFPNLGLISDLYDWDPHKNRMFATFFDPNFLGMYFVICLGISIKRMKRSALASTLLVTFFSLGILLTFSRSAWLAASVLMFFVLLKKKVFLIFAFILVLLAFLAVPRIQTRLTGITDPSDSTHFRLTSWSNSLQIIKVNWAFGIGYNAYRYAQLNYGLIAASAASSRSGAGSDASLLLAFADTGVVGITILVCFWLGVFLKGLKTKKMYISGLVAALALNSIFINSLFYPQIFVALLVVVAAEGFEPSTPAM